MKHYYYFLFFLFFLSLNMQAQQWIGAITQEDAHLPVGRRDFHNPSLKKDSIKAIYDKISPLALRSILLRKSFFIGKSVQKAEVRISGLGHYLLSVNGKKVNNDIFTPAWSDYDKTVYYNTYQLDTLLQMGENVLGVSLGNGFYNAVGNRYRKLWVSFGPPTLFFKMHLYYADGSQETIVSDNSWKYDLSPITFNDIYGGEDYDARLEQPGWDKAGFADYSWKPVVIQEAPKGKLRSQTLTSVRCMEEFEIQSVKLIDSSYVLDMGQNLSGYPAIKVSGKSGQSIRLTVGEQLNPETGKVSQRESGSPHFYTYTLKGDKAEEWRPDFSYYGFRYIQIDGASALYLADGRRHSGFDQPSPEKGCIVESVKSQFIYNSTPETGYFECSNELFNRIHRLIKNAVKSNMQTVFTDCPHREKLGWLEETHLNGPGLIYNWDMRRFFPKIMQDIQDSQQENGMIPNIAPEYVEFNFGSGAFRESPEWGIASVVLPWMYYQFYGDNSLMINYFDLMKQYVDYLSSRAEAHILSFGLGDWYDYGEHRAGFSKNSPVEVSATAHYYYAAHLLSLVSNEINRSTDQQKYAALANRIKQAFNEKFFNKETKQYGVGSQFCNAVALFMEIVEPQYKQAVLENLKADIRQHGNRLTTGDIGNRYLFQTLALNGENELMYLMNNHEDTPGYGFQLKFGATTLTEQWDPRLGASWNHLMMGQIEEWFFRSLAGIEPVAPGFKKLKIQPQAVGDLSYVKASYKTIYGIISVEWKKEKKRFHLSVTIPANTQATVILPDREVRQVGAGRHDFESAAALPPFTLVGD